MKPMGHSTAALGLTVMLLTAPLGALAQEPPIDDIAVAVRDQGYACDDPQSADLDPDASSAEEKAWILHCAGASYRVKFLGDTGASVEPLAE